MRLFYPVVVFLVFLMYGVDSFAQYKIIGSVADPNDHIKLHHASVVLLNPKDSILTQFGWTGENGQFSLENLDIGHYKLIISYPHYVDLVKDIQISSENLDLGPIYLSKAAVLLEEVQVNGKIPIVIKGDTLEYDASSFKLEKNANVEELLKALPGITMDGSGKITAQGKEVKKVLLDGEEFFGDDPTLITKNIRSDMVSKVQVYEKRSELAVRTGVDDGLRSQTIDIKLKDDKKNGLFGQAVAGTGTEKYYAGKAMFNKFKGVRKIAAYGIIANDGMVGLGFQDGQKYGIGGGGNMQLTDGMLLMSAAGGEDTEENWDGKYNGGGVPKTINIGANYSDKSSDEKHKININFKRNQINVSNTNSYRAQNNLPEIVQIDNNITKSENKIKSNVGNLKYEYQVDSLTDLSVNMGFTKSSRNILSQTEADQRTIENSLITNTRSRTDLNTDLDKFNIDAILTRKFKKERQSITFNVKADAKKESSETDYFSENFFGADNRIDTIDQFKYDRLSNSKLEMSLIYTEPLSKNLTGSIGYSFAANRSQTLNQSFNRDLSTGQYTRLDSNLLNDFHTTSVKYGINTAINYKTNSLTVNISNRTDLEDVRRRYNNIDKSLDRNQLSFNPSLFLNYKISKNKSLGFQYQGQTAQPSLTQIEPLKQNIQPFIEYIDNPNLKAGFKNTYSINYNSYKQLKDQSFYFYLAANQEIRSISNYISYNPENGKRKISSVNIDKENWSLYGSGAFSFIVQKKWGVRMNIGMDLDYKTQYSYLSSGAQEPSINKNKSWSLGPRIGLSRYQANTLDFNVLLSPGIEQMTSFLQPELNQTNFRLNSNAQVNYYLPKDFKISMSLQQNYQAATQTLESINLMNMNGYISKKFLKDKSLEAQIFVNDMLNKNTGLRRYQDGASFIQSSNEVLGRYGMLKLIYNFTTMKGGSK